MRGAGLHDPKVQGVNQPSFRRVPGVNLAEDRGCGIARSPKVQGVTQPSCPKVPGVTLAADWTGGATSPRVEAVTLPSRPNVQGVNTALDRFLLRSSEVQGVNQPSCPKELQGVNLAGGLGGRDHLRFRG